MFSDRMHDYEEGGGDSFDDAPMLSSELGKRRERIVPFAPTVPSAPGGGGPSEDEEDNALESLDTEHEDWAIG